MVLLAVDAASGGAHAAPTATALGASKSTPVLPQIGRPGAVVHAAAAPPHSSGFASRLAKSQEATSAAAPSGAIAPARYHPFALGLSPADRSLLPLQQKQKRNKHVGCQTDTTELAELRTLQTQLGSVKKQLSDVGSELAHAERRLRNEVREEMEGRLAKYEKRTMEKVTFLKQKQRSGVDIMRQASKAQLESKLAEMEHTMKAEYQAIRAAEEAELEELRAALEQKSLLLAGYERENSMLRQKAGMGGAGGGGGGARGGKQLDVAEHAQLEAALAQRDAAIKALREQLARMQEGGGGGTAQQQLLSKSSSMPTVIANKQAR